MAPSEPGEDPQQGGTAQADEPSAYSFNLKSSQTEGFEELATPELKNVTMTLPEGVSISPSAGDGLVACPAKGPEGIDIPTGVDGAGEPLHDNEAGEGEEIGADGQSHLAKGHCPGASTLGTVDVFTPDLPTRCGGEGQEACKEPDEAAPLQGHVYLAQPECGGEGQPACSPAYAEGRADPPAKASCSASTLKSKAPVSSSSCPVMSPPTHSPASCRPPSGKTRSSPSANSTCTCTAAPGRRSPTHRRVARSRRPQTSPRGQTRRAQGTSPAFNVDWDGNGGLPAELPFAPAFEAGTTTPTAGGFTQFT